MPDADVVVSKAGDLLLNVRHDQDGEVFRYRVESARLGSASHYFEVLLSERFNEGARIAAQHKSLKEQYKTFDEAPASELPWIDIMDIGRISRVSTIKDIVADFLRVLHGQDLSSPNPPLANIANLTIVADRFDSLPMLSAYMKRKNIFRKIDAKKIAKELEEERCRQRILVGTLLQWAPWVAIPSKRLILHGSKLWESVGNDEPHPALWWDLPQGIEDELQYRREMVLDTIGSIQAHFLKLYTSGERQCKLGYDSSLACDSFQLGEMVKFLSRAGTLRLRSSIFDPEEPAQYLGDVDHLLEDLRKCSTYQIDSNHSHCGLRTRLIPLLDWIQSWLEKDRGSAELGLCADCWQTRKAEYAWLGAKRPLSWRRSAAAPSGARIRMTSASAECSHSHIVAREMFTAVQRDWT